MENMIITGSYDWSLVFLSYMIAVAAAYIALNFVTSLNNSNGKNRKLAIATGGLSLGTGIWVMHFIGMMAYKTPMAMSFDLPITLLSYGITVIASWLALYVATSAGVTKIKFIASAILFSAAVSSMHYLGMYAMKMPAEITYKSEILALSIAIALAASFLAFYLLFHIQKKGNNNPNIKIVSALVIGLGVVGLHYTGMEAMEIKFISSMQGMEGEMLDNNLIVVGVSILTVLLMGFNVVLPIINEKKVGRERIAFMVLTMATTTTIIVLVAIGFLYSSTYSQYKNHLSDIAKTNVNLINAVARFDKKHSQDAHEEGARAATIEQVIDALHTGEDISYGADIMLIGDGGENIKIIHSNLHHDEHGDQLIQRTEYSKQNMITLPYLQALSGKSGVTPADNIVSGEKILLAYEPIAELGLALVVETEMEKIWAPFKYALYLTLFIGIIAIMAG